MATYHFSMNRIVLKWNETKSGTREKKNKKTVSESGSVRTQRLAVAHNCRGAATHTHTHRHYRCCCTPSNVSVSTQTPFVEENYSPPLRKSCRLISFTWTFSLCSALKCKCMWASVYESWKWNTRFQFLQCADWFATATSQRF